MGRRWAEAMSTGLALLSLLTACTSTHGHDAACTEPASRPRIISGDIPKYTAEAKRRGIGGSTRLTISVDPSGNVSAIRQEGPLDAGLDESLRRMGQSLKFEPAEQCGRAVAGEFVMRVSFVPHPTAEP